MTTPEPSVSPTVVGNSYATSAQNFVAPTAVTPAAAADAIPEALDANS